MKLIYDSAGDLMKLSSIFIRIKNNTAMERIWEIMSDRLAKNEKKLNRLIKRYSLYRITNRNNSYDTYNYLCYYKLKEKYGHVLEENLSNTETPQDSKKVWICWFQGEENAPDIVKACIRSLRNQLSDWEIIVLTNNNISKYVEFPDYITEKVGGAISLTHFSDILRVCLLNRYGGLWLDSTVFCSSREFADYIKTLPLFVYRNVDMARRDIIPIVAESWMIYSKSNQKILLMVEKLLFEYWKNESKSINYFLFHLFFTLSTEKYSEEWGAVPVFSEVPPNIMGFELMNKYDILRWNQLTRMSDFHNLSYKWPHGDESDPNTLYNFILRQNQE